MPSDDVPQRKIVHIDMDAFYASVEQRDNPGLRGRPLIVAWRGKRSVVCAASYEARAFGVRSAMPALRAERLCPEAIFVPPDFPRYQAVSRKVREIFARHTDLVEPLSLDEAYLDVTSTKIALPTATATARAIRAAIRAETALTASAGVAPNKFLAKVASDWNKPDGLFIIRPHQVDAFVARLPVARIPGVGRVMQRKLAKLGVTTCADLRELDVEVLERYFGSWGRRLSALAHGLDQRPVQTERSTVQISSEDTFAEDLTLAQIEPHLQRLALKTWQAYARERIRHPDRFAHTVVLKLKTNQFKVLTRQLTLSHAPTSPEQLASIACALRERVHLPISTRFRLAGIGLSGFSCACTNTEQEDLFNTHI